MLVWSLGGMILTEENRRTRRETSPIVTLCPPQIPLELTRASVVTGRLPTVSAMAQLNDKLYWSI
jgi:hypothetical protein